MGSTLPVTCNVGELFYKVNTPAGANLYGCTTSDIWTVEGSVASVPMVSLVGEFAVARTSATTLSIGSNCSASTPCNARFGSVVYSFLSGATVTISGGTGLAFGYMDSSGTLMVGSSLTLSCTSGCAAQSGGTSFPPDSIPLFIWTATNGSWDLAGKLDERAFLSAKSVVPGSGLISVEASGLSILSLDPVVAGQRTAVPATSTSACVSGSWAANASFYYVCASQNSWRRVALSSF